MTNTIRDAYEYIRVGLWHTSKINDEILYELYTGPSTDLVCHAAIVVKDELRDG